MQTWTNADHQMMSHIGDVIGDRMHHEDGYTDQDQATVTKLDEMTKQLADTDAKVMVVDLTRQPHRDEATAALQAIVRLELRHWVPDASQRLIRRASLLLGFPAAPVPTSKDHGPGRNDHALFPNWVAGLYMEQCATCHRLFREDA
jgi:hypothetical protein